MAFALLGALHVMEASAAGLIFTEVYDQVSGYLERAQGAVGRRECPGETANQERDLQGLRRELDAFRERGDPLGEGATLRRLGVALRKSGDLEAARDGLTRAIEIALHLGHKELEGLSRLNLGKVFQDLGVFDRSIQEFELASGAFRYATSPRSERRALVEIGNLHLRLGRFRQAAEALRKALIISERLGGRRLISQDLQSLALGHVGMGEVEQALLMYERSLEVTAGGGFEKERADSLRDMGSLLLEIGRLSEGLEHSEVALAIYSKAGLDRELLDALNTLGILNRFLGDAKSAEDYFMRSLALSREQGSTSLEISNLLALGDLEWHRGRLRIATALFLQVADAGKEMADSGVEAEGRLRLALVLRDAKQLDHAAREAERSLRLAKEIGVQTRNAAAHFAVGDIALRRGRPDRAVRAFDHGLKLIEEARAPRVGWLLHRGRGRALEAMGRADEAVAAYQRAVADLESARSRLRSRTAIDVLNERSLSAYAELAMFLLRLGREEKAFSYSERQRLQAEFGLMTRGVMPLAEGASGQREVELRQRVRRLDRELEAVTAVATGDRVGVADAIRHLLVDAERDYSRLMSTLQGVDEQLARSWSLSVPSSRMVRRALPRQTGLVEYLVADEKVGLFWIDGEGLQTFMVPLTRRGLISRVDLLRDLVTRSEDGSWLKASQGLGRLLFDPLEGSGVLSSVSQLILVPHDILYHLPFAALVVGGSSGLLVESHVLTQLPSASLLIDKRSSPSLADRLLAIAAPGARLRFAAVEVASTVELFPRRHHLLVGEMATEGAFKRQAGRFGTLHIAGHSTWNGVNPMSSAIELEADSGEDGRLEVREILDLDLSAELVILSSCRSALIGGQETQIPTGLARAFLRAGSDAVLASLWDIDDQSTYEMMLRFYRELEESQPAAALAAAQRSALKNAQLAHPFHWAGLVLIGIER